MIIVLSHGVRGAIMTADEKEIAMDEIMAYFNRDNCPALVGKPKMFFIQACQGSKLKSFWIFCCHNKTNTISTLQLVSR
jgi:hypothetical protein